MSGERKRRYKEGRYREGDRKKEPKKVDKESKEESSREDQTPKQMVLYHFSKFAGEEGVVCGVREKMGCQMTSTVTVNRPGMMIT